MQIKNICCICAGYDGGQSIAVIAEKFPQLQFDIVDVNKERIEKRNSKILDNSPIYEPALLDLVKKK